jgi:hypothetical protein
MNSKDGFGDSSSQISFDLTNVTGSWSSASDVLIANSQGNLAAAHVFITTSPANASNSAISTQFASETGSNTLPAVPLPGTVWAGMALLGFAAIIQRKHGFGFPT